MMPLWVFLLGRFFIDPSKVAVPTVEIVKSLAFLVVPCFFGFLVTAYKKEFGEKCVKASKPVGLLYLCYQFIANGFINTYIFKVMVQHPKIIAGAVLLPFCAFVFGYVIAVLARQPRPRALTIALETGVQNVGIPVVMLMYAFPPPEGDLGAVVPIASAYLMSVPLFLAWLITAIYKRCTKTKENNIEVVESKGDLNGDVEDNGKLSRSSSVDQLSEVFDDNSEVTASPKTYVFVTDGSNTQVDDKLTSV